jgi:hypothetical protein
MSEDTRIAAEDVNAAQLVKLRYFGTRPMLQGVNHEQFAWVVE